MSETLSSIASRQSKATENLEKEVKHFLDYCATHQNSGVKFHVSDMILVMHSDGLYLSESESRGRAAGHFYLSKFNNENSTMEQ